MIGSLGINLRVLRLTKNLTQFEVAYKLGISNCTLSRYERDIAMPNEQMLKKLADFYGVTVKQLIEEDF